MFNGVRYRVKSLLAFVSVGTTIRASEFGDKICDALRRSLIKVKYAFSTFELKKGDVKDGISNNCLKTVSIVARNCERCLPTRSKVDNLVQVGLFGEL